MAGKVLKKVQHKYGDVTEQQVTSLLQQVLQQDNNRCVCLCWLPA